MKHRDIKDFGEMLVLVVSRNYLELTFALGWTAAVVGIWKVAPVLLAAN